MRSHGSSGGFIIQEILFVLGLLGILIPVMITAVMRTSIILGRIQRVMECESIGEPESPFLIPRSIPLFSESPSRSGEEL